MAKGSSKKAPEKKAAEKKPARKVTFATRAPDHVRAVVLTGDFTGWAMDALRLDRDADGLWRATLELAPGEYQYRLLWDGEWADDPNASRRARNAFGTENCILVIS